VKIKELTKEVLKEELVKYKLANNKVAKNDSSADYSFIKKLEDEYSMRFIGAHVNKDKLNFQVLQKINGSNNYTTATISIQDFRNSTTMLRFAYSASNYIMQRAEMKNSPEYFKMMEQASQMQKNKEVKTTENKEENNGKYANPLSTPPYFAASNRFIRQGPSLEELALTTHAIRTMPDANAIRQQIAPIRKYASANIGSYVQ
jgi:hypothetical protein